MLKIGQPVPRTVKKGKTSLRGPKLSTKEVKRLMKKKMVGPSYR
jgi:hypothetical protein